MILTKLRRALDDAKAGILQGKPHEEMTQREMGDIHRAHQEILIDAMEHRLGVPYRIEVFDWTLFKCLLVKGPIPQLPAPSWFDHYNVWGDDNLRFLTVEPYRTVKVTDDDIRAYSDEHGYDGWFRLPPELGSWRPPRCHVIAFYKAREGYSTDPNVIMA